MEVGEILDKEMSCSVDDVRYSLETTEKGKVKASIDNCTIILDRDPLLKGSLRENEFTGRINITRNLGWKRSGNNLTTTDEYEYQRYIEKNYGISYDKVISKAIRLTARDHSYHPIKEFLEGLKWDGTERVHTLMPKYLGSDDNEYTKTVMFLLMNAAIKRIYEPGCKFETMVCLVGGQGIGKSSFFRLLACNDDWFSDDLKRLDDENIFRKIQAHWIIEMPEMLATMTARSIEDIKSFLSRQRDTYKVPYEVHPEDRPRQCVFVGTSNTLDFLPMDRTGNRRFVPILVHPEKVEKHILEDEEESRAYIKQAWAEVFYKYRQKEPVLKLSKEMAEHLKELQSEFMPEDTNVGIIQAWLDDTAEEYVCTRMIYKEALGGLERPKTWDLREISSIMNNSIVGWEQVSSHRFKKEYGTQRAWKRITDENGFISVPADMELPFS